MSSITLTAGPTQFFWSPERWSAFHRELAAAPVDRVVLGELVCSKRAPFHAGLMADVVAELVRSGKETVLTSLALVTLKRERKASAALAEAGLEVEVNDLTALALLPEGAAFSIGPLVNVYNEGTLRLLARRGARRICLPPELPFASVERLARTGAEEGVAVEVWGHGRAPLAIAGRCYHARLHDRAKDDCRFACENDPDGLEISTTDGRPFLSMNGVQTLSHAHLCAVRQSARLAAAGVGSLRLSPQTVGFVDICRVWRAHLDGSLDAAAAERELRRISPDAILADGFLDGAPGASWAGKSLAAEGPLQGETR